MSGSATDSVARHFGTWTAGSAAPVGRAGFTLIEIILVVLIVAALSGITLPYFAGSFRGTQLRSASRTIDRMAKYSRSMAIMREQTLTLALNPQTMEVFVGSESASSTNQADGELDQAVLKRLGYIEGTDSYGSDAGLEKEIHRFLPDTLSVRDFSKESVDDEDEFSDLYMVRFFPNGQCEWFKLVLEDSKGDGVLLEIDPISGKLSAELLQ